MQPDARLHPGRGHFFWLALLATGVTAYAATLPAGNDAGRVTAAVDRTLLFFWHLHGWTDTAARLVECTAFAGTAALWMAALRADQRGWVRHLLAAIFVTAAMWGFANASHRYFRQWHPLTATRAQPLWEAASGWAGVLAWLLFGGLVLRAWRRIGRFASWSMAILNFAAVVLITVMLRGVAEDWWFAAAAMYLPRAPFALPSLLLAAVTCVVHRRAAVVNGLSLAIACGIMMEWNPPRVGSRPPAGPHALELRIASCNVQNFRPDFPAIAGEILAFEPDIVAFQDAREAHPALAGYFKSWHQQASGEFWVGSRFPVSLVAEVTMPSGRARMARFAVKTPAGTVFVNVHHQSSPREALSALSPSSLWTNAGRNEFEKFLAFRADEARRHRAFVDEADAEVPALVVGDFNMPSSSKVYRRNWGWGYRNAFDLAGRGYGYTFSATTRNRWPPGVPWIRIDHILLSPHWICEQCRVGVSNGSDHRPVFAVLKLPGTGAEPNIDQ